MIKEKKADFVGFNVNAEKIKKLIEGPINKAGYQLFAINVFEESTNLFLQIVIDGKNGISLDDCVTVTEMINPILDKNEDMFERQYIIDVCSKGVDIKDGQ